MTADRWVPFEARGARLATARQRSESRLQFAVVEPEAHVVLRCKPEMTLLEPIGNALAAPLPVEPNTVSYGDGWASRVLWMGPDEWLIVGDARSGDAIEHAIRDAARDDHCSVVDVSAARCVLWVAGEGAPELLALGCPIDLDPRLFGPGRCAQTLLARASVLLEAVTDEPSYRVTVRPSYARYLEQWLFDAATDWLSES